MNTSELFWLQTIAPVKHIGALPEPSGSMKMSIRCSRNWPTEKKVSTNHLVNKALRRYGEWEVLAERYGFVTISSRMLGVLFEKLTIEEARHMGRDAGGPSTIEFIQFYFKKFNYDTTMKTLELFGHQYARNYNFEKSGEGDDEMIIMKHGRGPKTSAYMAEALKGLFGQLGTKIEVMETEDQIVAKVAR